MTDYRELDPGMGEAVAARTVLRDIDGVREHWGQVGERVATGNVSLVPGTSEVERQLLAAHIKQASALPAGRHLQQGDADQALRPGEVVTNCSSAAMSSIKKYLMLNGSGVGRSYANELMIVDWALQPTVIVTIGMVPDDCTSPNLVPGTLHPEAEASGYSTKEEAMWFFPSATIFEVPDSREGWAKAVEQVERMAFEKRTMEVLILDFSRVRPKGSPIGGMQGRPASGPVPFMSALAGINELRLTDIPKWKQTMIVDHKLAEVVQVGGARRAARIAIKPWDDEGIFEFITIKQTGGLWTANNSVAVDAEFWALVKEGHESFARQDNFIENRTLMAYSVFMEVMRAQYEHGSGEPGFINVDKLMQNDEGMEVYEDGIFAGNSRFQLDDSSIDLGKALHKALVGMKYKMIVNPCAEIPLLVTGGYCVLGSVVPFHASSPEQGIEAAKVMARGLVRANQMEFLYGKEVKRTNRIGLTIVGLFETAWKFFGLTFRDLLDPRGAGKAFWQYVAQMRREVLADVDAYCDANGWVRPHTVFTMQPAGTIAKLFGLTEAAHLPAMLWYLRWVQFASEDPLVDEYEAKGFPVIRTIKKGDGSVAYKGMSIVGFPTQPTITTLGIPAELMVTADEATPEEQFAFLRTLEEYWIGETRGNQVSYTLKYKREGITFRDYVNLMLDHLPTVRCVSIMPSDDWRATKSLYGYVPEEPISQAEYEDLMAGISDVHNEGLDMDSLQCASGACPI